MKATNTNGVWKKLCSQFVHDFKKTGEAVIGKVVQFGRQLELEMDADDVQQQLLESHSQPLSNEDLMELEAHKEARGDEEVNKIPKRFIIKGMAEAFSLIEKGLATRD